MSIYEPNEPGAPTFIQWKGTSVCMDVRCPRCGERGHIDGDFVYAVECAGCGTLWKLGQSVSMKEVSKDEWDGCEQWMFGREYETSKSDPHCQRQADEAAVREALALALSHRTMAPETAARLTAAVERLFGAAPDLAT